MRRTVEYFDTPGPDNTQECIRIVEDLVKEGFRDVVVASTTGATGAAMSEALAEYDVNLVVVTHSAGFREPNHSELEPDKKETILDKGGKIYTGTILTHSLETALATQHQGLYPAMLIAQTLRRLGQGIKVVCEIVMEACDAGLLSEGVEVVAVGGTGRGADTVAIVKSAASKRFLDLKVLEILAKSRV